MALGLYKPGQGYWVRVLTATFAGVVILAGSAWLWAQLERAADWIPKSTAVVTLQAPVTGAAAAGQPVTLMGEPTSAGPHEIGTGVVRATEALPSGAVKVTLERMKFNGREDASLIKGVAPAPAGASLAGTLAGNPELKPLIQPLYVQGTGVAIAMLLGSILTYWLVGVKERTAEFLIATDGEMRKVNWSTRKDVLSSTWVVIMWSILLAGGLFLIDFMFSSFFKIIKLIG